jgi:subtilisin
MSTSPRTLLAAAASALVLAATAAPMTAVAAPVPAVNIGQTGGYIVVLDDSAVARSVATAHAQRFGFELGHVYGSALQGYSASMTPTVASAVAALPGVDFVQADTPVQADVQTTPTGINRANADLSPTAQINGTDQRVDVDVAVIDTGVDLDHPDLNVHRAGARSCTLLGLSADDDHGHGSHVAGTVGALDNTTGVVGMAPGARIWPVKVLNALGSGLNSDVICGIDYVTAHASEIEVANMSLGGAGEDDGDCGATNDDALHASICKAVAAGITFVVAAGNDSADAAGSTPAAYDEVITVSALADFNGQPGGGAPSTCRADQDDTFASFSNYGADVDMIAPGVCIHSTSMNGGYATLSGTSMASPHVAGAAALIAATNPSYGPSQIRNQLIATGSTVWNDADDPDSTQERLLDAATY